MAAKKSKQGKKKVAKKVTRRVAKKAAPAAKPKRTVIPRAPLRSRVVAHALGTARDALKFAQEINPSPATESRILDLEMKLAEAEHKAEEAEKRAAEVEAKLRDADGSVDRPEPLKPARAAKPTKPAPVRKYVHERGPPRLGFERVDGKQVPDEAERALVRACVKLWRLTNSTEAIRRLEAKDPPVRLRGRPWTPSRLAWAEKHVQAWDADAEHDSVEASGEAALTDEDRAEMAS